MAMGTRQPATTLAFVIRSAGPVGLTHEIGNRIPISVTDAISHFICARSTPSDRRNRTTTEAIARPKLSTMARIDSTVPTSPTS